ncbi:hypothetical protein Tco_1049037 [Tanacetum coccineum]
MNNQPSPRCGEGYSYLAWPVTLRLSYFDPVSLVEFNRISLTGFRSCTSRSHYQSVLKADNTDLTSHLLQSLFDVGSGRISIVTMNTFKYHSDVLTISQG